MVDQQQTPFEECPGCKGLNMRMMVSVTISTPAKNLKGLSKEVLCSEETEVWGVDWNRAFATCPDCGWTYDPSMGIFYSQVRKDIEENQNE